MDEIDSSLRVFDPKHPRLGTSHRQIDIGNDCYIILSIDPDDPKALPECHFIGSDSEVNILHGMWRRNCQRWYISLFISPFWFLSIIFFMSVMHILIKLMILEVYELVPSTGVELLNRIEDKPFAENLVNLLKIQLPGPPDEQKSEQQSECGICYAPYLPIDDELGTKSGSGTDYTCEY
ncbi:PREDICTED: E3 ubiquitin-protein ligase FANCL-like isoform X1 [Ipomoea nil]|uniref:E3 ubiquitin-protein ligase FANCL-like isoform X1 n=1 Tax=Ipomoea nil TaxID=35883 RepID=UPI00090111BB|nr:PREDICTED: E3 ubiquitin-protein ligase FANCL-like isoform X1 [Ipomoea nil]